MSDLWYRWGWLLCWWPRLHGSPVPSNYAFERTGEQRGRDVLAKDGVLAGAEWALYRAAQRNR